MRNYLSVGIKKFSTSTSVSPLAGVTVIDLTRILAGPFCTMLLGDLGANVIKIEQPKVGDDTRRWGPPFIGDQSCYFLSINRNKKSIAVDLKQPQGQMIVNQLVKKADVLVENFLPGKLDSMGLGYDKLNKINNTLVYCSISGYGSNGPYSNRGGYDVIAASVGGLLHITGPRGGEPCKVGVAMTDIATGLYAKGAIMTALLQRFRTGQGQKIECDLLSTQVSCLVNLASNYLNAQQEAERLGTAHQNIVPYQTFKTKDGHLTLGAGNDTQFEMLCKRLKMEECVKDPRFSTNQQRVKKRDELCQMLEVKLKEKTTEEWLNELEGCGIPYGPVNNMEQVFNNPQVKHLDLVQTADHPTAGKIRMVGPAVKFSQSENKIRSVPPRLGEHTDDTLRDLLNYSDIQLKDLKQRNVIQ